MQIQVLGSAAGGGFPQWNCNCSMCKGQRAGTIKTQARTQSSIAIRGDTLDWVLINTSPDILTQIKSFPALQPARHLRDTAISAIVLTDAQIDHVTGLLMLREGCPHDVYCTSQVQQDLTEGFPLFGVLSSYNGGLNIQTINTDTRSFQIPTCKNLNFTAIPLVSNAPPYSPHRDNPQPGDNIGLVVEDSITGKTLFYAPGVGQIEGNLIDAANRSDCILIDGTVWTNDEMRLAGVGQKLGTDMGHLPQSGPGGMIEFLNKLESKRKILIHINNTNPILNESSEQYKMLKTQGIEVSYDGMSIEL